MIKCQICGYENPDDMQVCMNCGSTIERQKMSNAIDDISGEATVLIGAPPKGFPPPPPPKASSQSTPPPPPPPQRPATPPQSSSFPPPPPPSNYGGGVPPGGNVPPGGFAPPGGAPMGGQPKMNVLSIVSLSTGVLSFFLCCCFYLWVPTSIAAIVTGFFARKQIQESNGRESGDKLAVAGMICGAVVFIACSILACIGLVFGTSIEEWAREMQQQNM